MDLRLISAEKVEAHNVDKTLSQLDGVLIGPGFGVRGTEGKVTALKYAREHNLPTFGIGLGMQCMSIEFARNILNIKDANSTEFNPNTDNKVIDLMDEQKSASSMGGSMRLGDFDCLVDKNSIAYRAYKKEHIQERHRHRFEFNNYYKDIFQSAGMKSAGINPETQLVEIIELNNHKWYLGVQFHPEYNSTVLSPHPLFVDFIKACINE